jgi:hypothetical protein
MRRAYYSLAYVGLMALTWREFQWDLSVLCLVFVAEAVITQAVAKWREYSFLSELGHIPAILGFVFFIAAFPTSDSLLSGDSGALAQILAVAGVGFAGTFFMVEEARRAYFATAYLGLMALTWREFQWDPSVLYLAFMAEAAFTQKVAQIKEDEFLSALGHLPAGLSIMVFAGFFREVGTLTGGNFGPLAELAALAGLAYIGILMATPEVRQAYLFTAYGCLLAWTARELLPLQQGQALLTLAWGVEGTAVLAYGYMKRESLAQKTGMGTLLILVGKVLLVDMAAVEPIWRVMLLGLFGALFLVLSKVVKEMRTEDKGPENEGSDGGTPTAEVGGEE